jgi:predicted transcriptional regulator
MRIRDWEKGMPSTTVTVRVDATVKRQLDKLATSTGCSRSYLAAEALQQDRAPSRGPHRFLSRG